MHKLHKIDARKFVSLSVLAGVSLFLLVDALHVSPAYGQSCSYQLVANPNNGWLAQQQNWIDYAGGNCVVWNDCAGACTGGNTNGCGARYCPAQHYGYYQYWSCQQVCSCSPNQGQSCSSSANSCGQVNTGTIQCDGSCSATTPANPGYLGQSCTSAANSCGQTNTGTLNCSDVCSASTPANPWYYGQSCSASNACGQTNYGTLNCSDSCSVGAPANPGYLGQSCTSAPNSCGMTNTGTLNCADVCSASTPSNALCQPNLQASASGSQTGYAGMPITLSGTARNVGGTATSGGFWNLLEICSNTGCSLAGAVSTAEQWLNSLGASASAPLSLGITAPTASGQYYYQWIANENTSGTNIVTESNYGDNASGWQSFVVNSCTPTGLSASPSTIILGNTTTLSWSVPAGCSNTCTVSNGDVVTNNQDTVTPPAPSGGNTDTYSVTCSGGPASTNVTVNVPTATVTASPNVVPSGGTTSLTWSSQYAPSCTMTRSGVDMGATFDLTSGSSVQDPTPITGQTVYKLTCNGATSKVVVDIAHKYIPY